MNSAWAQQRRPQNDPSPIAREHDGQSTPPCAFASAIFEIHADNIEGVIISQSAGRVPPQLSVSTDTCNSSSPSLEFRRVCV